MCDLYSVRSEALLMEQLQYNLLFRRFAYNLIRMRNLLAAAA